MAPNKRPAGNRNRHRAIAVDGRYRNHNGDLRERRAAGAAARDRQRRRDQPEQRQAGRNSGGQQQHPHGLHDRDRRQIGAELGRERDHLRHRAWARTHQRRQRVPAVHDTQIGRGGDEHAERRDHHQRDAHRPGDDSSKRLRRHHGAEQNADQHVAGARQRHRHLDRPPQQCRGGDRENRPGDQAGRKADQRERRPAGQRDNQRLSGFDECPERGGRGHLSGECLLRGGAVKVNLGSPVAVSKP